MKALIIDDSRAMRTLLRSLMKKEGFETAEAENGKAALQQLEAIGTCDIALVDWNMPEMNGYEFVKAVRARPAHNNMMLMMVTTEAEIDQVTRALEAGANEYLIKPFSKDAIREKLQLLGVLAA